jgi:hypothetical protein
MKSINKLADNSFIDLKFNLPEAILPHPHIMRRLMNSGKTIFSQLMRLIPVTSFAGAWSRYNGNYKIKSFSRRDQLLRMAFAQLNCQ